jgi:hypothetical protein
MQFEVIKNGKAIGITESNPTFAFLYWEKRGAKLVPLDKEAKLYTEQRNFIALLTGKNGIGL